MAGQAGETPEQWQELDLHDFSFLRWCGLSAEAAAARLNVSLRTLQRWAGSRDPRIWTAVPGYGEEEIHEDRDCDLHLAQHP